MSRKIRILHLYPRDMNIYGDMGNVLTVKKRLEWYGYEPEVLSYNPGDKFPADIDIIIGGGGQDSGQGKIQDDLVALGPKLRELARDGLPMLVICGLYQLFGNFFQTISGEIIKGIVVLNIETYGKQERLIGNIVVHSEQFGDIIGYENHSGQTFLFSGVEALGKVKLGAGNNLSDRLEGARVNNVIGSYMHGSLLPKNPQIADFLIEQAAIRRYGEFKPTGEIDDSLAKLARQRALKRPR